MAEVIIPPWVLPVSPETVTLLDDASTIFQPAFARGLPQVQTWADPRWQIKRKYQGMRGDERAALRRALNDARGKGAIVRATVHQPLRGSFPAVELLTNSDFKNGTTGWTAGAEHSIAVMDRVMRSTRTQMTGAQYLFSQNVATAVQYAPYVLRAFIDIGRGNYTAGTGPGPYIQDGLQNGYVGGSAVGGLLNSLPIVRIGPNFNGTGVYDNQATGLIAGDFVDVPYISLSRCMLADNGPNLLTYSEDYSQAAWVKSGSTVNINIHTSPDATGTATVLHEDTNTSEHYVEQSFTVAAAAGYFVFGICVHSGIGAGSIRTLVAVSLVENTGPSVAYAYFDVNAGTTQGVVAGANWSNVQQWIVGMGNGYYYCIVGGWKANAATTLRARVQPMTAVGTINYLGAGSGTEALVIWRATAAKSGVPTRLVQTTTAANPGVAPSGGVMPVKGLPASTSGLLLTDDFFEWNGELKQCTASLDSDAAGLGYLQFRPGLASTPGDGDAIIVLNPMGRFRLMSQTQYDNQFGLYMDLDIELSEVYG